MIKRNIIFISVIYIFCFVVDAKATLIDFYMTDMNSSTIANLEINENIYNRTNTNNSSASSSVFINQLDAETGVTLRGTSNITNNINDLTTHDSTTSFWLYGTHTWGYTFHSPNGNPPDSLPFSYELYGDFNYSIVFAIDAASTIKLYASTNCDSVFNNTLTYSLLDPYSNVIFSGYEYGESFYNLSSTGQYTLSVQGYANMMGSGEHNSLSTCNNGSNYYINTEIVSPSPVPEPATFILFCSGLLGLRLSNRILGPLKS